MKVGAYFDVDGTLAETTSITPLWWYRRRRGTAADLIWCALFALRVPFWALEYKRDSTTAMRSLSRNYRGFNAAWMRGEAQHFEECVRPRRFDLIVDRLKKLQHDGVHVTFVTGGLDFVLRPFADSLGVEMIAPGIVEQGGVFTGEMTRPPLLGNEKYLAVQKHSAAHGIDLRASYAFGNEIADADMLGAVGHPVAVRPDKRLRKVALERGWEIADAVF